MNHLLLSAISLGFGSFAWSLLALSDWLLGDRRPRIASQPLPLPAEERTTVHRTITGNTPPPANVPAARRAS